MDLSPLRTSRDYRNLFASGLVTGLGSYATYVAMPFQIADLTGSYLAVGVLGVVEVVPLVVFGLWGGVVADRRDRRQMVLVTEVSMLVLTSLLLANTIFWTPRVWLIYVVSLVFAALDGLQRPSLDALLPRLVDRDQLRAAGALQSLRGNIAHIAGPAIGGVCIAIAGVEAAYGLDSVSFLASGALLLRVRRVPPSAGERDHPWRELRTALRYVGTRRDILGTYAADTAAMMFAFPFALFPFIAIEYEAPWSLGFLYSAIAVGSLVATVTSGWTARVHHHGRAVVVAAGSWGLALAVAGLIHDVRWVIPCLALAGAADMISGLFRSLIWNRTIPDELRGRMAGLELLSYGVGPQVGQIRSTVTARFSSVQTSLLVGGAVCAASMPAVVRALPEVWRLDAREDGSTGAADGGTPAG